MKDKKTLKIASIIVAVLIAIVCITKILAAGATFEDGKIEDSTAWGMYRVTKDGEVEYKAEGYTGVKEGVDGLDQAETLVANGVGYEELSTKWWIFCIQHGYPLPTKSHNSNIYKLAKSTETLNSRFHDASVNNAILGIDTQSGALTPEERNAIEYESKIGQGIKFNTMLAYKEYEKTNLEYWQRRLDPSNANVTEVSTKDETMDWASGYILANADTTSTVEENEAQKALWKVLNFNKDKDAALPESDLYKKAKAFEKYRKKVTGEGPTLNKDADEEYKYRFNLEGNYLIAGPINVEYGELESEYNGTKLEVRQIDELILYGTTVSGSREEITDYEFTDANGNPLTDMVETVDGKKFPKTGTEFWIKVKYDDTYYDKFVSIDSFEASFYELDLEASAYKVEDVDVIYTEWAPNNIIYENCILKHTYYVSGGSHRDGYCSHSYDDPKHTNRRVGQYNPDGSIAYFLVDCKYKTSSEETTETAHLKGDTASCVTTCSKRHEDCKVIVTGHKKDEAKSRSVVIKQNDSEAVPAQNLWLLHEAKMFWRKYKLVVLFGPENTPETPSPTPSDTPTPTPSETPTPDTHRTYIDIGGNVWVDLENTKTDGAGEQEGVGEMGTNKDYPRENVKVTLKYKELNDNSDSEGSLVTKDMIAKWAQSNFKNPTNTDKNGRYDFYQLPMDKKYYVEFTYDGMTYTTTKFLAGGDTSDYKDNPNKEVYKINSKAEEDGKKREEFNARFAEILGTGAKSYNKSKNETTGKTNDESTKLVYRTKTFDEKFQSRLLTTDNEKDVINRYNDDDPHESGIARPGKEEDKDKYENEDYEMTVSTRNSGLIYPFFKDNELIIFDAKDYENNKEDKLEYLKHINLGLVRREKADLAIAVDIKAGGTSIKDTQFAKLVTFRTYQEENGMMTTVTDEETDAYINYKKQYKRDEIVQDVAGTDYWWLANLDGVYGDKKNIYTDEDGLNVYVLYKIILANHSDSKSTEATITGLVDYFSKGLAIPNSEKDKANIKKIFEKYGAADVDGAYSWTDGDKKKVEWENKGTEGEYTTLKTKEGFELKIGDSGKTKAIYLVLKVEKEANQRLATGGTEGLKNITEIASYKITKDGKPAGLVDCDSAPYNATPGDKDTYEDDTDDAPVFKLNVVNNAKKIEGNVWEDLEGTKGNNIDNVKVELVEYIYKDGKIVDQVPRPGLTVTNNGDSVGVEVASNKRTQSGHYEFYVEGGNYAIKFTYGDQEMLMSKDMKYNGQDYQASKNIYVPLSKSEFYNKSAKNGDGEGIIINKAVATTSELVEYLNAKALLYVDKLNVKKSGNNDQIDWESTNWKADTSKNEASNARDLTSFRTEVIKNAIVQDNAKSDLLHKLSNEGPLDEATAKELSGFGDNPNYTHVEAISDIVVVESNDLADCSKVVNLALSKRPETDVKLEKKVTRIVLTASDKTILIDTSDSAKQSNLQKDPVEDIQTALMYLDTSAMEGATIDIYYTITVTNEAEESDKVGNYIYDGEVDGRSKDSKFIVDQAEDFGVLLDELKKVFGNAIENENSPIPIRADKIYDYVNINLDYKASDNGGEDAIWKKIYDEDDNSCNDINDLQIDKDIIGSFRKLAKRVSKVLETNDNANTVKKDTGNIYATDVPDKNNVSIEIHLGMLLTEDTADDVDDPMVYRNAAEIIQLDTFGRRDPEIIVGNYDPYNPEDETEPDSSVTGTTTIIPPTGENRAVYIVLPIISIGIVIIGIILIKKKVLKK